MPAAAKKDVYEALSAVMADVQAVGKNEKQQGFRFRGVDAVVNTVGPALRKHGVVVVGHPVNITLDEYAAKGGTRMTHAVVTMHYVFHGPDGSSIEAGAFGESADAGDKAVSKAQSIAYRVTLLQALCIPTDEPDPDLDSNERGPAPAPDPDQRARELGWMSQRERDVAVKDLGKRLKALDAESHQDVKDSLAAKGITSATMTPDQASEFNDLLTQYEPPSQEA